MTSPPSGTKALLMTRDFDPIAEIAVEDEADGSSAFVNVGWGKKETQFHGSEGKVAALASKEKKPLVPVSEGDDLRPRAAWRDDGQMFAVSFVASVEGSSVRRFRVFSREGEPMFTSERTDGLEHCLAWRPAGSQLIASTQRTPVKHLVGGEKFSLNHLPQPFSTRFASSRRTASATATLPFPFLPTPSMWNILSGAETLKP